MQDRYKNQSNYEKLSKTTVKRKKYGNMGRKYEAKQLQQTETTATRSSLGCEDLSQLDFDNTQSTMVQFELKGLLLQFNCLKIQQVRCFLTGLDNIGQTRQKVVQIKIIVLDSICRVNPLMKGLMDEVCEDYSAYQEGKLFS